MGGITSKSTTTTTNLPPLQTVSNCITEKMMGAWFVIAVKPTPFETKNSNAVERYTWIPEKDRKNNKGHHDFDIEFQFNTNEPITSNLKTMPQKGWIDDEHTDKQQQQQQEPRIQTKTGNWKISPLWPIKLSYLILEADTTNYQYCIVGYPSRAYCWILARTPQISDELYQDLCGRLTGKHQYDLTGLRLVPQKWTKEEREKRQLVQEIPDQMLETTSTSTTTD